MKEEEEEEEEETRQPMVKNNFIWIRQSVVDQDFVLTKQTTFFANIFYHSQIMCSSAESGQWKKER